MTNSENKSTSRYIGFESSLYSYLHKESPHQMGTNNVFHLNQFIHKESCGKWEHKPPCLEGRGNTIYIDIFPSKATIPFLLDDYLIFHSESLYHRTQHEFPTP